MDEEIFLPRRFSHLAPFFEGTIFGRCSLDLSVAACTTKELDSGYKNRNSLPLDGTKYCFLALFRVGAQEAGACHIIFAGSTMTSLIRRALDWGLSTVKCLTIYSGAPELLQVVSAAWTSPCAGGVPDIA